MPNLQLLTTEEVSRLLRLSTETVRQLAAVGKLPGRKVGRVWRFPESAIEAFALETTPQHPSSRSGTDSPEPSQR